MAEDSRVSVLVVDDEEIVRCSLRHQLESAYELHFADGSDVAFEILARRRIDVVISDYMMPGTMRGTQFLRVVRYLYPHAVRIMLTGDASLGAAVDAINKGEVFRFVEKPWNPENLRAVLAAACQRLRHDLPSGRADDRS